jgi:4-diphosphocytidyl-2-C-methyl-D-erythritol kinase
MLIRHAEGRVFIRTPAKVNLFLEVLARRPDGYHDLATLMAAVSLYDTLEIRSAPGSEVRLECDHPDLSTGPDNLVSRAAALVRQRCGLKQGAAIRLYKRIPTAAGLAGGSSDAAAALAGLNILWRLGLSQSELVEMGGQLGSDVSFFLASPVHAAASAGGSKGALGRWAAWCTGRGELVEPVPVGRPLDLVLVCPSVGLSTAQVFRGLQAEYSLDPPGGQGKLFETPRNGRAVRQALAAGNVEETGRQLFNRLQATAERLCPEVAHWRQRLAEIGPTGQLMTGSGSSVFALCRDGVEALRIARELCSGRDERAGFRVFIVRSCD